MSTAPELPYRKHLQSANSLVTAPAATRAGFIGLAIEKNRRATPFVDEARRLQFAASPATVPADLNTISDIKANLWTAAGLSDKALNHLPIADRDEAVVRLIADHLEPAGKRFVEELVFRFLLIRGDTLGGSMRNAGGAIAQRKLTRALISTLKNAGITYRWQHVQFRTWAEQPEDDAEIEQSLRGLSWQIDDTIRTLLFNVKVPLVGRSGNNVDLCVFNRTTDEVDLAAVLTDATAYVALGELKGGIDPAGADEHWKTASTALDRIRKAIGGAATFFIGAAIENSMASEIWKHLEDGELANAANLTDEDQLSSICRWLCDL